MRCVLHNEIGHCCMPFSERRSSPQKCLAVTILPPSHRDKSEESDSVQCGYGGCHTGNGMTGAEWAALANAAHSAHYSTSCVSTSTIATLYLREFLMHQVFLSPLCPHPNQSCCADRLMCCLGLSICVRRTARRFMTAETRLLKPAKCNVTLLLPIDFDQVQG